jgi:hypothetical protein
MYVLNYGPDGKVHSIQNGNMSIPLVASNADFQDFLVWNSQQSVPLDLNSTIPPDIPVPPRDLGAEITALTTFVGADVTPPHSTVSAVILSIARDKLSCVVRRVYNGVNYDFKALVTAAIEDKLGKHGGANVDDTVLVTYVSHAPIGTLPIIVDRISAIVYP